MRLQCFAAYMLGRWEAGKKTHFRLIVLLPLELESPRSFHKV